MAVSFPVRYYDVIDSTNSEALRLTKAGYIEPVWLVAQEQTAGRGRNGRTWISGTGGVYATLLYSTGLPESRIADLGGAMSLAIFDTVARFVPRHMVSLKWPNDCLVNGAKICGMLSEVCGRDPLRIAIGCGINVTHSPKNLPYDATCIRQFSASTTVSDVFSVLNEMSMHYLSIAEAGEQARIWRMWLERSQPLGTLLKVNGNKRSFEGFFAGLTENGALILEDHDGKSHVIYSGDVHIGAPT